MSRTQLPAQTLGEAVEALNWVGNWAVGGHDRTRSFSPKKKNRTPRVKFFWRGKEIGGWTHSCNLNACKNLHHCNMQQGSFTMAKDLNHRQFSSNLHLRISGLGVDPILEIGNPSLIWYTLPAINKDCHLKNICQPSPLLISRSAEDQIIERHHSRPTDPQTKRIQNRFPAQQLPTDSGYQLAPGETSHCGCDVTVGISPQGWFGRINLHAWWFNGHTIDSPICYTKANLADLPWFSQHFRWVFARFFSMSGLSVRFFEGHFLVLEFTTLEFGSFGWSDWIVSMKQISRRDLNGSIPRDVVKRCKDEI